MAVGYIHVLLWIIVEMFHLNISRSVLGPFLRMNAENR
uniref:Uncharacterized protein n=1 Tax=Candidatus Kentrum sp. FW TaxID=2126338 RepID=A0A450TJ01_9GAMM|nr:MAG: hypothetical protein BECKFW1821C_GA0114237_101158 [Candidatus Kentron sp. FW]